MTKCSDLVVQLAAGNILSYHWHNHRSTTILGYEYSIFQYSEVIRFRIVMDNCHHSSAEWSGHIFPPVLSESWVNEHWLTVIWDWNTDQGWLYIFGYEVGMFGCVDIWENVTIWLSDGSYCCGGQQLGYCSLIPNYNMRSFRWPIGWTLLAFQSSNDKVIQRKALCKAHQSPEEHLWCVEVLNVLVVELYEDTMICSLETMPQLLYSLHNGQHLPMIVQVVLIQRGAFWKVEDDRPEYEENFMCFECWLLETHLHQSTEWWALPVRMVWNEFNSHSSFQLLKHECCILSPFPSEVLRCFANLRFVRYVQYQCCYGGRYPDILLVKAYKV